MVWEETSRGASGVDGVEDAGNEISETFADASACFEKKRGVADKRLGRGKSHRLLLWAVFQAQDTAKPAFGAEDTLGEL